MKVQRNKWVPEKYRFESYEDATVYEGEHVNLFQRDDHPDYGVRFDLVVGDQTFEMEGAVMAFHTGDLMVRGYVADRDRHPYFTDILRREVWFLLES